MNTSVNKFSALADLGMSVFPVQWGDKKPAVKWTDYQKARATSEEVSCWDAGQYNVGVVCGRLSGLLVFDVDSDDAQALYDSLSPPLTPTVRTGKGRHYYYRYPADEIGNRVRVGDVALDVRGEGGYVVGPGSLHPSGEFYRWDVAPADVEFAEIPESLLALLRKKPASKSSAPARDIILHAVQTDNRFASWIDERLRDCVASIRHADEGKRNDTLNRAAYFIATLVAAAGLTWEPFANELRAAAMSVGLAVGEAESTILSAWQGGCRSPAAWIGTAQKYAYVGMGNRFCLLDGSRCITPQAFNTLHDSERQWEKGAIGKFLTDNDLISKVIDFRFDPEKPTGVYEHGGNQWLNTYVDPAIEPIEGDESPFCDFIQYLVPNDEERSHLLNMIAWTVRNPGSKLGHALLFGSEQQGIGKSTLLEIWRALLGVGNTRLTTTEEINGPYQNFISGALLVLVEELNMSFGAQNYNRIKNLITGHTAEVNEKFVASREMRNHATFVFLTNLAVPILIEDSDRRMFYISSPAFPREPQFYREFNVWWRSNLGVIRRLINEVDLSEFDPFAPPPETEAKANLKVASMLPIEQELLAAIEEARWPFSRDVVRLEEVRSSLHSSYQSVSLSKIGAALQRVGAVNLGQQRTSGVWSSIGGNGHGVFIAQPGSRPSLWAVRNVEYWRFAADADRAAEYGRQIGTYAEFSEAGIEVLHASIHDDIYRQLMAV